MSDANRTQNDDTAGGAVHSSYGCGTNSRGVPWHHYLELHPPWVPAPPWQVSSSHETKNHFPRQNTTGGTWR